MRAQKREERTSGEYDVAALTNGQKEPFCSFPFSIRPPFFREVPPLFSLHPHGGGGEKPSRYTRGRKARKGERSREEGAEKSQSIYLLCLPSPLCAKRRQQQRVAEGRSGKAKRVEGKKEKKQGGVNGRKAPFLPFAPTSLLNARG